MQKNRFENSNVFVLDSESLQILEEDYPKFQEYYICQKYPALPSDLIEEEKTSFQFHQLMQQILMGLPVAPLLKAYPFLQHWVNQLRSCAPEIFENKPNYFLLPYHHKSLQYQQDYLLSCIYDLLIVGCTAQIIDWTIQRPPSSGWLENSWRTQMNMFLLAETDSYLPDQISMTYWFVNDEEKPISYRFQYSQQQHQMFSQRLKATIGAISVENALVTSVEKSKSIITEQMSEADYLNTIPEIEI